MSSDIDYKCDFFTEGNEETILDEIKSGKNELANLIKDKIKNAFFSGNDSVIIEINREYFCTLQLEIMVKILTKNGYIIYESKPKLQIANISSSYSKK
jgi:hypothetical protein